MEFRTSAVRKLCPGVCAAALALLAFGLAWAQPPGFVAIMQLTPDSERGAELFASQCTECHGAGGNHSDPAVPRLAGQIHDFELIQLWNFRDGGRPGTVMPAIAAGLSDQDIADLSAFVSEQTPASPPYEPNDPVLVEQGAMLFNLGNHSSGLVACAVCHGMAGEGVAQLGIPRIAGQSPEYLRHILHEFAEIPDIGVPQVSAMTIIARTLTDAELNAVVEFLSSQPWGQAP